MFYVTFFTLALAAVPSFAHPGRRDASPSLDSFASAQSAIAVQGVLDNTGLDGIYAAGASAGVIIASPCNTNPNYYFTWTRDSAIAIKALVDHLILTGDASLQDIINAWIVSQAEIQTVSTAIGTLNDGSGLGEAKFQVDGSAINGNAGNPENDAPALRAIALEEYARYLIDNGDIETASGLLWSVLANDLAYVKQYWNSTSFDVWEEIQGPSFFTATVSYRALVEGDAVASALGQTCDSCTDIAAELLCSGDNFWSEDLGYVIGTFADDRCGIDANTLLASVHGFDSGASCDEATLQPCSARALANHKKVTDVFRAMYPINTGIGRGSGVAVGRYPEDTFFGGNPWYITTLAAAEQLYDAVMQWVSLGSLTVTDVDLGFWQDIYPDAATGTFVSDSPDFTAMLQAVSNYADSYMAVVQNYTPPNGSLSEQFDKADGIPKSAYDLTWSYAAFLSAVHSRMSFSTASWGEPSADIVPRTCGTNTMPGTYVAATAAVGEGPGSGIGSGSGSGQGYGSVTCPTDIKLFFGITADIPDTSELYVAGSIDVLGNWDTDSALPLDKGQWTADYPLFTGLLTIPKAVTSFEWKLFQVDDTGNIVWESGDNQVFSVPSGACTTTISGSLTGTTFNPGTSSNSRGGSGSGSGGGMQSGGSSGKSTGGGSSSSSSMGSGSSGGSGTGSPVALTFNELVPTVVGQTVWLAGNITQLGSWFSNNNGVALGASNYTDSFPLWSALTSIPAGTVFEYRLYILNTTTQAKTWLGTGNAYYTVPSGTPAVSIWGDYRTSTSPGSSDPSKVPGSSAVHFNEIVPTITGQKVYIAGDVPELGSWDPTKALALGAADYTDARPLWSGLQYFVPGQVVTYRVFISQPNNTITWIGQNSQFTVPSDSSFSTEDDLSAYVPSATNDITLVFNELIATVTGQTVYVAGNIIELGAWGTGEALALEASSYSTSWPVWTGSVSLPAGTVVDYRPYIKQGSSTTWIGTNKITTVTESTPGSGHDYLLDDWRAASVQVAFSALVDTVPGQTVWVTGNVPQLGNFITSAAVALSASTWTAQNPLWTGTINLSAGQVIQYRFFTLENGAVTYLSAANIAAAIPSGVPLYTIWGDFISGTIPLTFNEYVTTLPGQSIYIVGNLSVLGNGDPAAALSLNSALYTDDSPLWTATVNADPGITYAYLPFRLDSSTGKFDYLTDNWIVRSVPLVAGAADTVIDTFSSVANVTFDVLANTIDGQTLWVVGNIAELGDGDPSEALALGADDYSDDNPLWSGSISLTEGTDFTYQVFRINLDGTITYLDSTPISYTMPTSETDDTIQRTIDTLVRVTFNEAATLADGESISVLGNLTALGSLVNVASFVLDPVLSALTNTPAFSGTLNLTQGTTFSYQFVKVEPDGTELYDLGLQDFTVPLVGNAVTISGTWGSGTTTTSAGSTSGSTSTATPGSSTNPNPLTPVTFYESISNYTTGTIYLLGNITQLGSWNTGNAIPVALTSTTTSAVTIGSATVQIPGGTPFAYKFIIKDNSGNVLYQSGSNQEGVAPFTTTAAPISGSWDVKNQVTASATQNSSPSKPSNPSNSNAPPASNTGAASGSTTTTPADTNTKLTSILFKETIGNYTGGAIYLVGNITQLSNWNTANGLPVSLGQLTNGVVTGTVTVQLPINTPFQYKFIVVSAAGTVLYQSGKNKVGTAPSTSASGEIDGAWDVAHDVNAPASTSTSPAALNMPTTVPMPNNPAATTPGNAPSSTSSTTSTVPLVDVTFHDTLPTNFANTVLLTGNYSQLGNWDPSKAIPLIGSSGAGSTSWSVTCRLPAGSTIQYKYLKTNSSGGPYWEAGNNHEYTCPPSGSGTAGTASLSGTGDTWQLPVGDATTGYAIGTATSAAGASRATSATRATTTTYNSNGSQNTQRSGTRTSTGNNSQNTGNGGNNNNNGNNNNGNNNSGNNNNGSGNNGNNNSGSGNGGSSNGGNGNR